MSSFSRGRLATAWRVAYNTHNEIRMSTPSLFQMVGADGREYGPIATEQLRQWIKEGRADRFTQVRPQGESWWKPLGQFPEFADLLPPPATPVLQPAATSPAGSEPADAAPSSPPPLSSPPVSAPAPFASTYPISTGAPKVDGMAIAGIILSALGLICCCGGPLFSGLGLAFSLIGLNSINRDPVNKTGKGLAIAGVVMGALGLLLFIAFMVSSPWNSDPFRELIRELKRL